MGPGSAFLPVLGSMPLYFYYSSSRFFVYVFLALASSGATLSLPLSAFSYRPSGFGIRSSAFRIRDSAFRLPLSAENWRALPLGWSQASDLSNNAEYKRNTYGSRYLRN
jgi:hypothetical protein